MAFTVAEDRGSEARFGGAKLLEGLGGHTLPARSAIPANAVSDGAVIAVPGGQHPPGLPDIEADLRIVAGGAQRADPARAGLAAVQDSDAVIVVADAAHPLASPARYAAVVDAVRAGAGGALPGLPLTMPAIRFQSCIARVRAVVTWVEFSKPALATRGLRRPNIRLLESSLAVR